MEIMDKEYGVKLAIGFGIGLLLGSAIGFLFAPQEGKKTREIVAKKAIEVKEAIAKKIPHKAKNVDEVH
jgi:gas vesicle protein